MGRHSAPDQSHFYRSLFGWVGIWVMLAVATAVGVWFLVSALGGDNVRSIAAGEPTGAREPAAAEPDPTVSGVRVAAEETSAPEEAEPAEKEADAATTDGAASRDVKKELVTEGVTVQVLNGTMKPEAGQAMADRLTKLGYTVVAVEESSRVYSETTVLWSTDDGMKAARALADSFGWVAEAKPSNLSDSVTFHVVVGADEG